MSQLLDEQRVLQKEADEVVALLHLEPMLGGIGQPIRVGSSAMGLMVRRDIDITVVCENLGLATRTAFADVGAKLMVMDRHVVSVLFRNDTGVWNADPAAYPDGLYLCLSVRTPADADWTVDIWAVDRPDRQPDLAHLRTLLPRITDEHREAILTIKQVLAARPGAAESRLPSAHVYDAVVDHGVRSLGQFEEWLAARSTSGTMRGALQTQPRPDI